MPLDRTTCVIRLSVALVCAAPAAAGIPNPLPNGVSVGDVDQTSAVLWARGGAGGDLTFEWDQDPDFGSVDGAITVRQADALVPAKAAIDGLEPGTTYHYRAFPAGRPGEAVAGVFRTAAPDGVSAGLRFGVGGDWRGELSPYPAIGNAPGRDLAFFLKLGDTIYADVASPAVPTSQATSIWEYRLKHGEVYAERFGLNAWRDLQASTAIYANIDDHEVTNDFQGGADPAGQPFFSLATAIAQTPTVVDSKEGNFADSDDPAIWVHPVDPALSIVVGTKKNGGLSVFDLDGVVLQEVLPDEVRYNNADILLGFDLDGVSTDIVVVTDRLNDLMVFFAIDPETRTISDVTDPANPRVFPDVDVEEQETCYGLGCYISPVDGASYAFVSRRSRNQVAQMELVDNGGLVGWTLARTIELPDSFGDWSPEDPQVEGIVVDDELQVAFLGQEQVGIWRVGAEPDSPESPSLVDVVREFEGPGGGGEHVSADVEGLTIYPTGPGTGYLIASSQGDDTFAVYTREAPHLHLGSFAVTGSGDVDGVQECDGADVTPLNLGPRFPTGVLVVQDGNNLPAVLVEDDGELENGATNFKIVPWSGVEAALFDGPDYVNRTQLYATGLQAFDEYNAIATETWTGTGDPRMDGRPRLYRYRTFGDDAALFVLDARSFRDEGLPPVENLNDPIEVAQFILASFDPSRTMLGVPQKERLKADLLDAQARGIRWKFVAVPEPIQNLGVLAASDRFEGYAAERNEILAFIEANGIDNVVWVAADIHGTLVNNLTYQTVPFGPQIQTASFEITTGSVAYDAPFGPTVVFLGAAVGVISPEQLAEYLALPDFAKDLFINAVINTALIPLGYDPLGLEGSPVDATLLAGGYVATHTYGWTEFEIDADGGALTVTTYGIPFYGEEELLADPAAIVALEPAVVSQFVVNAAPRPCDADLDGSGAVDGADLGQLLANWGTDGVGDLDGSGIVDGADLGLLLAAWGDC